MKIFMCLIFATATTACAQPTMSRTEAPLNVGDGYFETLPSGNSNDWTSSNCYTGGPSICQLTGNADGTSRITGLSSGNWGHGDMIWIANRGAYPIILAHASTASTLSNRLALTAGHDEIIAPGRVVILYAQLDWSSDPSPFIGFRELTGNGIVDVTATTTPSRSLGTAFQPNATRTTLVTYSASADCTISLSGGQEGRVEILSDSANPPTTVRGDVTGCKATGTVVLGVSEVNGARGTVTYMVPASDYVLLRSVNVTGTPSYALTHQTEQSL
jgi:hypothetical protein